MTETTRNEAARLLKIARQAILARRMDPERDCTCDVRWNVYCPDHGTKESSR